MSKRAKQGELPGIERKQIKEVSDAAENYRDARDERIKASVPEKETKEALIKVMRKHELLTYRDDEADIVITLVSKDNVKVTQVDDEQEEAA